MVLMDDNWQLGEMGLWNLVEKDPNVTTAALSGQSKYLNKKNNILLLALFLISRELCW